MRIDEITQAHRDPPVNEVVGGLARLAGQAIAKSPVGQAVGRAVGAAKQGFQQSAVGQTLQRASDTERQTRQTQNIQTLSQTALKQWGNKVAALTNASGGQPISDDEYNDHLQDFVQKTLLNDRTVDQLDANSQNRLDAGIDAVMRNRGDRQALAQSFNQLVTAATVARDDPARTRYQYQQSASPAAAQQLNPRQAASAVRQALNQPTPKAIMAALAQAPGAGAQVPRTNSTLANALLKAAGFQVT